MGWTVVAGVLVVVWACASGWGAIVHGHPLYGVLLGVTLLGSVVVGWRTVRQGHRRAQRHGAWHVALLVVALAWIAVLTWLRPFPAAEPAVTALRSDTKVSVVESATRIVLSPTGSPSSTGVFFQPGARVDPRAYAALLRPMAEAGHVVVIVKQPLSIAFLAGADLDRTRRDHQQITRWIVGGHSLGGTVAAAQADTADTDATAPVVGLFLHASYPAGDISTSLHASTLSISGSRDGLATPDKISASKATLPRGTTFISIDGAVHSFFADYGPQPGDGTPTISHDQARSQISRATADFVNDLSS